MSKLLIICTLVCAIFFKTCGGEVNFALGLRSALAASPILVESLPISANKKALTNDFTQMGDKTLVLSEDIKACAEDKPCKLTAVGKYSTAIESILSRPEFGNIPKLATIMGIVRGIIASARVFYGGPAPMGAPPVTEKSIKAQIDELRREMQP